MIPIIINNSAWNEVQKYRAENKYISLPFAFSGNSETSRQKEIRKLMNKYDYIRSDDETNETIEAMNENCDTKKYKVLESFNGLNQHYLLDFNNGLKGHVMIVDEYYGRGESSYYISLEGIINENDEIDDAAVNEVAKYMDRIFNE